MYRRIIGSFAIMVVVAGLTACSAGNNNSSSDIGAVTEENDAKEEDTTVENSGDDSKIGSGSEDDLSEGKNDDLDESAKNTDDTTVESNAVLSDNKEGVILNYYNDNRYYIIDYNGVKIAEYYKKDFSDAFGKAGIANVEDVTIMAYGDGVLYGYYWDYKKEKYSFYAIDIKSTQVVKIWGAKKGYSVEAVDYYNGKLYIDMMDEKCRYYEYVYVKDDSELSFAAEDNEIKDFLESCKGHIMNCMSVNREHEYSSTCCSFKRCLDENGYVVGNKNTAKNDKAVSVYVDGRVTGLKKITKACNGGNITIRGYDSNYIIFNPWDESGEDKRLYCYNIAKDTLAVIGEKDDNIIYLGYCKDAMYYYNNDNEQFGHFEYNVFMYKPSTDTASKIYKTESIPGTGIDGADAVIPGVTDFEVINGNIYSVYIDKYTLAWGKIVPEDGKADFKDIGCIISDVKALSFGTVKYESGIVKCDKCGIPLKRFYHEVFELDSAQSAEYEKINKSLKKLMNDNLKAYKKLPADSGSTDCSEHKETPSAFCEDNTMQVADVNIIKERYLAVLMSGYTYSGGAHGYPLRTQYLFDINTGKRLGIKDLFKGTEKELKKLIAEKTVEDFKSYKDKDDETSPYFAQNEKDVYEQAYSSAGFKTSNFEFVEDGVRVLYYPYEMGSYASGFISFTIPYNELGITL